MVVEEMPKVAVILAAGEGSRLGKISTSRQKPLIIVGEGKERMPIIVHQIEAMKQAGVDHFIIIAKHLKEQVHEYFDRPEFSKSVTVLDIDDSRGPADPLGRRSLQEKIRSLGANQFFFLNGDMVSDIDFRKLGEQHSANGAVMTMAAFKVPGREQYKYGILKTVRGKSTDFIEKPIVPLIDNTRKKIRHLAGAGISVISTEIFNLPGLDKHRFIDGIARILIQSKQLGVHLHSGTVIDAGTKEGLSAANRFMSTLLQQKPYRPSVGGHQ